MDTGLMFLGLWLSRGEEYDFPFSIFHLVIGGFNLQVQEDGVVELIDS